MLPLPSLSTGNSATFQAFSNLNNPAIPRIAARRESPNGAHVMRFVLCRALSVSPALRLARPNLLKTNTFNCPSTTESRSGAHNVLLCRRRVSLAWVFLPVKNVYFMSGFS